MIQFTDIWSLTMQELGLQQLMRFLFQQVQQSMCMLILLGGFYSQGTNKMLVNQKGGNTCFSTPSQWCFHLNHGSMMINEETMRKHKLIKLTWSKKLVALKPGEVDCRVSMKEKARNILTATPTEQVANTSYQTLECKLCEVVVNDGSLKLNLLFKSAVKKKCSVSNSCR